MPEQIITKRCPKCKTIKPISKFNKHRIGGRQSYCKSCLKIYQRNYRKTVKGKATSKRYNQGAKGKATRRHYEQSEKGKNTKTRYNQSAKGKVKRKARITRYEQSEKGKATKKHYHLSKKGKAMLRATTKRSRTHHPNQYKAVNAVNHAIKSDKLPRPDTLQCSYCPSQAKQYHHHKGYAPENWLEVVPICVPCHGKTRIAS